METSKISSNVMNLAMPRGRISFAPVNDSGVMTGEVDLGNCTSLDFTAGLAYKEHLTAHDGLVVLDAKKITEIKPTIKIVPEERSKENMALFFLGDVDKQKGASADLVSQTKNTITEQAATIYLDRWIDLGKKYVKEDSILIKVGAGADVALTSQTAGTYRIDYENGLIMILSTNATYTDTESVKITFKYGTCALPKFYPRTKPLIGLLRYRGVSEVGPRHHIKFWKVQITPDAALKMIDPTNYSGLSFSGDVYIDDDSGAHPSDPFYELTELSTASSYPS
jgi:hypothetical protein